MGVMPLYRHRYEDRPQTFSVLWERDVYLQGDARRWRERVFATVAFMGLFVHMCAENVGSPQRVVQRTRAYFRQGVALQYLGRHADALAAFASGLAQDPKSLQLLVGMIEAAMKSPLRESLEPTYQQLQKMKLDKSPFVVVSVIGQELLTASHHTASVVVLEAALKIGTCSLKLRGSVFSALSSAHWSLGNTEKSTGYMQQDLEVAKTLGDQTGECRAHGNLGSAFFSKGNYREALTNHRNQLVLAMKLKDREVCGIVLRPAFLCSGCLEGI
ncbi:Tetratricopeptide repeat protein 28 [Larimichthys crocea]|uniref:Uncharacterized protein n=1 Tax=Larimichthys crocea TaxID=215358 RepID=A0ACD3QAI6_LARCR|nr:Tetratricopeptide repeat protein 28 [Larimichthys crocea]